MRARIYRVKDERGNEELEEDGEVEEEKSYKRRWQQE